MKVAMLTTAWYPATGGGVVHIENLANQLVDNHRCEVEIITRGESKEPEHQRLSERISVVKSSEGEMKSRLLNELSYTLNATKCVYAGNYDVVHAHTNVATIPLQLARFGGIPTIVTVHGANLDFSVTFTESILDKVYTYIRRLMLERFRYDALISVSKELEEVLSAYHECVKYIPNGVDVDSFPDKGKFSKDLLFVGRIRPKKNSTDLIKSMPSILEQHPGTTLHIVGDGPLRTHLEDMILDYGIESSVNIYGHVSEEQLNKLYQLCSIFVLPSDWEGHPLVLLEAWASGMVVVGTDVEGIREFLTPHEFGSIVPLNTPKAISSAVSQFLSNPVKTEKLGKNAQIFVRKEYTWEKTAGKTYNLYKSITGQGDCDL